VNWIEIITLRTGSADPEAPAAELRAALAQIPAENTGVRIRLLVNPSLSGDLSIHLHHRTEDALPPTVVVGVHLAQALEDFGLVHRTLWREVRPGTKGE